MDPSRALSAKERVAVQALRERIEDLLPKLNKYLSHDLGLVRYLRARELNLDKAEDMLRKNLQWRADNENMLQKEVPLETVAAYPFKVTGFSKNGCLAGCAHIGSWDLKKTVDAGKKDNLILLWTHIFDAAVAAMAKNSTPDRYVSQVFLIFDFEGFAFSQLVSKEVIETICEGLRIFEANYPEILGKCIVINAPKIFQVLWAIVKPMLTARTISKICIYGTNKDVWKKAIFTDADPDNVPSEYGGAITTCKLFSFKKGFEMFPKYIDHSQKEMLTRFIQAGQKYDVELYMKAGHKLSWNFKTEDCDIIFRVDFDGRRPVVQQRRVDSQAFTQKGCIICEESGKYTLTFDNSFSTFRGKTLKYVIQTYDASHDLNDANSNEIN